MLIGQPECRSKKNQVSMCDVTPRILNAEGGRGGLQIGCWGRKGGKKKGNDDALRKEAGEGRKGGHRGCHMRNPKKPSEAERLLGGENNLGIRGRGKCDVPARKTSPHAQEKSSPFRKSDKGESS